MTTPIKRWALWLLVGWLGVAVLALAAAHAHERLKLIGLYALVIGAIAGCAMGMLARRLKLRRAAVLFALAWPTILAGQLLLTYETHRLWANRTQARLHADPLAEISAQAAASGKTAAAKDQTAAWRELEASSQRSQAARARLLSFRGYLDDRLSPFGRTVKHEPEVFWAGEILLAATLGAWLASRLGGHGRPAAQRTAPPSTPILGPHDSA